MTWKLNVAALLLLFFQFVREVERNSVKTYFKTEMEPVRIFSTLTDR